MKYKKSFIINIIVTFIYTIGTTVLFFFPWLTMSGKAYKGLHFPLLILKQLFTSENANNSFLTSNISIIFTAFLLIFCITIVTMLILSLLSKQKTYINQFTQHILHITFCLIPLLVTATVVMVYAEEAAFFLNFSLFIAGTVLLSIIFKFRETYLLIRHLISQGETYREYLNYATDFKNEMTDFFISIRTKLLTIFIILVVCIIIVTVSWVLRDYKHTILSDVKMYGSRLSESCNKFIKENLGDTIEINNFLESEKKKNISQSLQFKDILFYEKLKGKDAYKVKAATDKKFLSKRLSKKLASLYTENNGNHYISRSTGMYHFPTVLTLAKKTVGYTVLIYTEKMIFKKYFKTQVRIILLTYIIIFIAVFLVYLIGTSIIRPILFLQLSVNKISTALSDMLSGGKQISAGLLAYDDATITSRDEVKVLSNEVRDMVGVIKGIIPYVSFSTLKQVKSKKKSSSTKKNLAFLFTDIRGFTTLCEKLTPHEAVETLNFYLNLQAQIILNNNGDIDKYMGDAIMASFTGAKKEVNAAKAALEIQEQMKAEREARQQKGHTAIAIGIGIHTGQVIFGSIGAQNRMDFTSIGDNVNLASRLEGTTKTYSTKNIVSEPVYKKIKTNYTCREIDLITVKGKAKPTAIYEVITEKSKETSTLKNYLKDFSAALKAYRQKKWAEAEKLFAKCQKINNIEDKPSKVFLERISIFRKHPPPSNWNGVFEMKTK
jgi:class 3 adenylate cyclase